MQFPNGLYTILYAVILVSTMDIFAYLGGKLFGKRKIIPAISKGKTIEGTIHWASFYYFDFLFYQGFNEL